MTDGIEKEVPSDARTVAITCEFEAIWKAARFVKAARESTGLSQRDFAKKIGIKAHEIATLESGSASETPSLERLIFIARASGKNFSLSLI